MVLRLGFYSISDLHEATELKRGFSTHHVLISSCVVLRLGVFAEVFAECGPLDSFAFADMFNATSADAQIRGLHCLDLAQKEWMDLARISTASKVIAMSTFRIWTFLSLFDSCLI